jgi:hypothetical protein
MQTQVKWKVQDFAGPSYDGLVVITQHATMQASIRPSFLYCHKILVWLLVKLFGVLRALRTSMFHYFVKEYLSS